MPGAISRDQLARDRPDVAALCPVPIVHAAATQPDPDRTRHRRRRLVRALGSLRLHDPAPTRYVLLPTVLAYSAPPSSPSRDRRAAALAVILGGSARGWGARPNGTGAAYRAVTWASSSAKPAPTVLGVGDLRLRHHPRRTFATRTPSSRERARHPGFCPGGSQPHRFDTLAGISGRRDRD